MLANAGAGACEVSEGLEEHLGRGRAMVCSVTPHQGCLPLETPRACTRYVCGHNPAQPVPGAAEGGRALGGTCWWPLHPFRAPLGAAACGGSPLAALPLLSHTETLGLSLRGLGRGGDRAQSTPRSAVSARRHRPCQAGPARLCRARPGPRPPGASGAAPLTPCF